MRPDAASETLGLGGAVFLVKPYGDDGCRVVPLHSSNRPHKSLGVLVGRANNHRVKAQQKPEVKTLDVVGVVQLHHSAWHALSVPAPCAMGVNKAHIKAHALGRCVALAAHAQQGFVPGHSAPPHLSCPA